MPKPAAPSEMEARVAELSRIVAESRQNLVELRARVDAHDRRFTRLESTMERLVDADTAMGLTLELVHGLLRRVAESLKLDPDHG